MSGLALFLSGVCTPLFFMSLRISSLQLSFDLPIFWCPLTAIFSLLHLLLHFSTHVLEPSQSRFSNFLSLRQLVTPALYHISSVMTPGLLNPLYFLFISSLFPLYFLFKMAALILLYCLSLWLLFLITV